MRKWLVKINKVTLLLTLSDIFTWGSFVVISALSGIYLAGKLGQDTVEFVGIGTGIYFITRGVFQIPVGILTDRLNKDKDEIAILAIGSILAGTPYLFYPHITEPWQYFLLQFIFGFGISLNVVNWRKMFALNVREGMEGKEYAFYDAVLSVSTAAVSVIFGIVANIGEKYFDMIMTLSGISMMLASVWILLIAKVQNRRSK